MCHASSDRAVSFCSVGHMSGSSHSDDRSHLARVRVVQKSEQSKDKISLFSCLNITSQSSICHYCAQFINKYSRYRPTWPRGDQEVKAPRFLDTRHVKVVSTGRLYSQEYLGTHF